MCRGLHAKTSAYERIEQKAAKQGYWKLYFIGGGNHPPRSTPGIDATDGLWVLSESAPVYLSSIPVFNDNTDTKGVYITWITVHPRNDDSRFLSW